MLVMECLIENPLKQISIGQCLLNAMKPSSVISPLLFILGVEINLARSSNLPLIGLSKLGYSISYDEVKWYKKSLIMSESTLPTSVIPGFTQFVPDDADDNVGSFDGIGTCHGMRIIACLTEQLPPTDEEAVQHALWVYLQITYWKELSNTEIDLPL